MLDQLRAQVAAEFARTGKRRRIKLIDDTLRDGQQCLWATRMRTEQMLPVAQLIEAAGVDSIMAIALVQYDASMLFLNQNPLERLRLLARHMPKTELRAAVRGNLMRGFFPVADDITELFVERNFANGARRFTLFDALLNNENLAPGINRAKALGAKTSVMLVFNDAPAYTDEIYAEKAREAVEDFGVDAIAFGDSAGVLPIDRIRTLVPAMKSAIGDRELEFTTHCMTGLGPVQYLEAAVHGVDVIYCSIDPMANGPAPAAMQDMVRDLRYLGFEVDVDIDKLDKAGDILRAMAEQEGQPLGEPAEYDPALFVNRYAGGALANLRMQLQAAGIADRLPEVLDEIGRVRVELGSPIMATPYPAIIAGQAVMNVLHGERYRVVPDEVKKYVLGYFGALPIPVDPDVADKVIGNGSQKIALTPPPMEPVVPALRARYPYADDDELLLRQMYGDEKFEGLGPTGTATEFSVTHPIVDLVSALGRNRSPVRASFWLGDSSVRVNGG
ncbi:MAG TPA: carboxylase [Rhodobacteraceae bacterium]|jgi:oxaloacetate decarboxylase alpha subunit|nr:carboxylase [Paracoccaceae bacterium]